jgi:hypothetical protein
MASNNVIAVSAKLRETAINTEQTLDTTMLWNMASLIDIDPRRQNNDNEAHGKEEVDTIYDRGKLSMWPAAHDMAQPQNIAFLMGYGMGNVVSTTLGAGKNTSLRRLPDQWIPIAIILHSRLCSAMAIRWPRDASPRCLLIP